MKTLEQYRQENDLNYYELADIFGTSHSWITRYIRSDEYCVAENSYLVLVKKTVDSQKLKNIHEEKFRNAYQPF